MDQVAPSQPIEVEKTFMFCDGHPLVGVYSGSDGLQYSVPDDPQCEQLLPEETFAPPAEVVKTFMFCDGHPLVGVYSGSDGRQYSVPNDPQCGQLARVETTRPYPTEDESFLETCMVKSGQTREECVANIQDSIDKGYIRVP
ncbi:hypothetical protein AZG88_35650 [Rhodococcus sp. LB1]|nr:hypothetical protein AZG88_35650 [Rhodococcus sp. LB1]